LRLVTASSCHLVTLLPVCPPTPCGRTRIPATSWRGETGRVEHAQRRRAARHIRILQTLRYTPPAGHGQGRRYPPPAPGSGPPAGAGGGGFAPLTTRAAPTPLWALVRGSRRCTESTHKTATGGSGASPPPCPIHRRYLPRRAAQSGTAF